MRPSLRTDAPPSAPRSGGAVPTARLSPTYSTRPTAAGAGRAAVSASAAAATATATVGASACAGRRRTRGPPRLAEDAVAPEPSRDHARRDRGAGAVEVYAVGLAHD